MIRTKQEPMPPAPRPDLVTFDRSDVVMPPLGLCVDCLTATNSSAWCVRVGHLNRGLAEELDGCTLTLPSGKTFNWHRGAEIPCGPDFLAELASVFGPDASFVEASNVPLPVFAVTTVGGDLLCGPCGVARRSKHNRRTTP